MATREEHSQAVQGEIMSPQGAEPRRILNEQDAIVIGAIVMSRVGVDPASAADEATKSKPVMLCTVWGEARSIGQRDSADGQSFTGLRGSFYCETYRKAHRLFRASMVFLPTAVADILLADFDQSFDKESGEVKPMKFAVDIAVIPGSGSTKYHYVGSVAMDREYHDPAFQVLKELQPARRQLLLAAD